MMKIRIGKKSITDIFMGLFIVILLAFRDYSSLVIVLSIILLGWLLITRARSGQIFKGIFKFLAMKLLFILLCMISALWSPNCSIMYLCTSMMFRLIICLCILLYINNEENLIKVMRFLVLGSIVLCLRMIIVVPTSAWGNSRVGVYLAHDIDNSYGNTGITYVLGIATAIIIADINYKIIKKKWKLLFIGIFTVFSLLSGSKKQIFILLIAYFTVKILNADGVSRFLRNTIYFFIGSVAIVYLILYVPVLYNAIGYRLVSFFSFFGKNSSANMEDLSTLSRISFLKDAINVFWANPIIGVGIDSFKYYNSFQFSWAECNYLELMADLGLVGLAVYYMPHIYIIKTMKIVKKNKESVSLMIYVLLLVLLFIDLTMVSYNETHLQLYLAILFSYCIIYKRNGGEVYDE